MTMAPYPCMWLIQPLLKILCDVKKQKDSNNVSQIGRMLRSRADGAEGDRMSTEEAAGLASGPDQLLQPPLNTQLECAKAGEPRHHIWLVTPSGLPQLSLLSSSSRQGY